MEKYIRTKKFLGTSFEKSSLKIFPMINENMLYLKKNVLIGNKIYKCIEKFIFFKKQFLLFIQSGNLCCRTREMFLDLEKHSMKI